VTSCYWVAGALNPNRYPGAAPGRIMRCSEYRYGGARPAGRECRVVKAAANRWHRLECVVEGNRITTSFNGHKVDEFSDSKQPFESGAIALFCRGDSTVLFKEISIQELPAKTRESVSAGRSPAAGR
jgi:hypothetical protein